MTTWSTKVVDMLPRSTAMVFVAVAPVRKPSAEKLAADSLFAKAQVQYLAFFLLVERRPNLLPYEGNRRESVTMKPKGSGRSFGPPRVVAEALADATA